MLKVRTFEKCLSVLFSVLNTIAREDLNGIVFDFTEPGKLKLFRTNGGVIFLITLDLGDTAVIDLDKNILADKAVILQSDEAMRFFVAMASMQPDIPLSFYVTFNNTLTVRNDLLGTSEPPIGVFKYSPITTKSFMDVFKPEISQEWYVHFDYPFARAMFSFLDQFAPAVVMRTDHYKNLIFSGANVADYPEIIDLQTALAARK